MNEEFKDAVNNCVDILKKGGIILYPTDTVWGIGCDAANADAVKKIFDLKKREDRKSMLVIVGNLDMVFSHFDHVPPVAWDLIEMSEKPLTLILSNPKGVAENLIPEENTLGIRVVKHEFCEAITRKLGRAIVSTSANISGKASPMTFDEISSEIINGVDYVVDKKFEGKPTRKPSSIIMLQPDLAFKIIRE